MRLRAAGRSACLPSWTCRSLAIARSLFLVGLRAGASLRAGLRRRLCCRVISYSIPDDMMLITGSCGIRLIVPLLVPSGGSLLILCLLDVCRRMPRRSAPVISSLSCLASCRLPLRASARASSRFVPPCHLIDRAVPWLLASPPRLIDTPGGAIR